DLFRAARGRQGVRGGWPFCRTHHRIAGDGAAEDARRGARRMGTQPCGVGNRRTFGAPQKQRSGFHHLKPPNRVRGQSLELEVVLTRLVLAPYLFLALQYSRRIAEMFSPRTPASRLWWKEPRLSNWLPHARFSFLIRRNLV